MLILFTGKGGVGKSTISATTAVHHASQGKKTILVSSDPAHSTDDVIGQKIGFVPTEIGENLWGLNINAEKQAKDFLERMNEGMMKLTANVPGFDPEILGDMAGFPGMEEYFGMEMIYTLMNDASYVQQAGHAWPSGGSFMRYMMRTPCVGYPRKHGPLT